MNAIDKAIDAGIKASDLYAIANEDIIRREDVREFFKAALRTWLKAQADKSGTARLSALSAMSKPPTR
jgi:hypothetical protein